MNAKVVLADFANDEEYHAIKAAHGTGFPDLRIHRENLQYATLHLESQGYEVAVEICDLAGYTEFRALQNAMNTPQTVAAYVVAKHGGMEKKFQPGLDHHNITVDRTTEVFCEMCKKSGLKKSEIAEICGISQADLNKYCSGLAEIPDNVFEKLKRQTEKRGE